MAPNNDYSKLQPSKDINPHTTPKIANTKSKTDQNKMHLPRDNITASIAMFNQTKQIIADIDKLSNSTTLCKQSLTSIKHKLSVQT